MFEELDPAFAWVVPGALAALAVAMLLTFVRVVRGPTLPDRVVALSLMSYIILAFTGVFIVATGQPGVINVALAVGLIVFLGTVVFARYLERVRLFEQEADHE